MGYADMEAARERLMQDAVECGYELTERSDCEGTVMEYLAEMYLFQEVDKDALDAFRSGEEGDGPLDPYADVGEFFTQALYDDFEGFTDRRPTLEELGRFQNEVEYWIGYHADEERKNRKSAA